MTDSREPPTSEPGHPVRRLGSLLLLPLLAAGLTVGCERSQSDDGSAEAESPARAGTVEAFILDGAGSVAEEGGAETGSADGGSETRVTEASTAAAESLRGRFRGNFIVALFSEEGGYWVDIGRRAEMEMDLRDPRPLALVRSAGDVPPGTYNRIRVLVCHSNVELEPGTRVGSRTVDAPSSVHLTETGDVVVEREVEPIRIGPGSRVELGIDLNSDRWLTEQAVLSDTISIPAFEQEVDVSVRSATD